MGPGTPIAGTVLLDACCVLNLYAGRCLRDLLRAGLRRHAVVERVVSKSLYVRSPPTGATEAQAGEEEREAVDLLPFFTEGLLSVLTIETEQEAAAFVGFATQLDDGEAMTCALARERGMAVATDDRKAQRVLQALAPPIPVLSTAALIKEWADSTGVEPDRLREILTAIRERAQFVPGRHDPLQTWWETAANSLR